MTPGQPKSDLTFPQSMVTSAISRWYPSRFPEEPFTERPFWRRADYPLVLPNGWPVPIWRLWPLLMEGGGLTEEKEGDTILALVGEKMRLEADLGWGTIKVVTGPHTDLHQLCAAHEAAMARVIAATEKLGAKLMGYGIQPMTFTHAGLLTKVPMYQAMFEAVGQPWLAFTATAADQLRFGVSRHELIDRLNLAAFAAPIVTAFCGNSPIFAMEDGYHCSGRDQTMSKISGEHPRYGLLDAPFESVGDMVTRFARLPFFLQVEGEGYAPHEGRFLDYIDAAQATGASTGTLVGAYLFHEASIWPAAKAHISDGTISMRAACQQPWQDHMVASALNFGLLEAGWKLHDFFHTYIDPPTAPRVPYGVRQPPDPDRAPWDSWSRMHDFAWKPVIHGLDAPEPFTGFYEGALQLAANALGARGLGEEVYLEPLWARLSARENPAQKIRRIYHRHGIRGMLDELAVVL